MPVCPDMANKRIIMLSFKLVWLNNFEVPHTLFEAQRLIESEEGKGGQGQNRTADTRIFQLCAL